MRDRIALMCFFLSGFAGLVYEVCWIRIASLTFGSTTAAVSAVLAVFFGGLAVGSVVFGRAAQRTSRPLRVYAVLEIALAVAALATPLAFAAADALYGRAYRVLGDAPVALGSLRVVLVSMVLLVPTVLMGGTLPLYCRQFVVQRSSIAGRVGFLYGWNTLGAAAGCAFAGFFAIPVLGVRASIALGALLSAVAGVVVWFLKVAPVEVGRPRVAAEREALSWRHGLIAAMFLVTGFVALGTEVVWTRFLALLLRNTVHTYTMTLSVVLAGIVLGSWVAGRLYDRAVPRVFVFGALQVLTGLSVLVLAKLPPEFWRGFDGEPAVYFVLLLPAAVLSGASFPLAIRLVLREPALAGIGVGIMSAVNTVGGILGALLTGVIGLPLLGLELSVRVLTGLSVATGLAAWLTAALPRSMRRWLVGAALSIGAWVAIPWISGVRLPADFLADEGSLIAFREGLVSNVAVVRGNDAVRLEIDRSWQGEDRKNHQFMAAHVPAMFHRAPGEVLVVGVGTGQTPSRFLLYEVERLDCVDIEPALFELVPDHFDSRWWRDDRVHAIPEDGRNYIAHGGATYDIVSLEVGQLFRPGVANFYTIEFYQLAWERLRPDGMLVQFVPLPFLSVDQFRGIVRSFVDVFPESLLWYNTSELLLIGVKGERVRIDLSRVERLLRDPAIGEDLKYSYWGGAEQQLNDVDVLLGGYLCGPERLATLAGDARPFHDDRPVLEYATTAADALQRNEIPIVELLRQHVQPIETVLEVDLPTERAARIREIRDANVMDMQAHANLRVVEVAGGSLPTETALALLTQALEWNPGNFACHRQLADVLTRAGRFDEARQAFSAALAIRPDDAPANRGIAFLLLQSGGFDAAIDHLHAALAQSPGDAVAHNYMGVALTRRGDLAGAARHLREAHRLHPDDPAIARNLAEVERALDRTP
jgi:spermidine synthase